MKTSALVAALGLSLLSGTAFADAGLAKDRNCLACHKITANEPLRKPGPTFADVASKYTKDKDAPARLAKKIRDGGVGVWGNIPMPQNPQVTEAEATKLARWVLSIK